MKISTKITLMIVSVVIVFVVAYIASNNFFADTPEDTGVEKIVGGDFENASSFNTDPSTANHWDVTTNTSQVAPALVTSDFGKSLEVAISNPAENAYNQISYPVSLSYGKLYQIEVVFGTEFGSSQINAFTGFGNNGSTPPGAVIYNRKMISVGDNDATLFRTYQSYLVDKPEAFFFIKIISSDTKAGKIKIKSVSVKEKTGTSLASLFPDKSVAYPGGTTPAIYKAIPWNLGEVNLPLRLLADSGTEVDATNKAVVYQHDTDDLDFNYRPKKDEVISSLFEDSAKGETKQFYFTVFANQDLNDLEVTVNDPLNPSLAITPVVEPGTTPNQVSTTTPTSSNTSDTTTHTVAKKPSGNSLPQVGVVKPKIFSLRYREKQPSDSNWGVFSYKNELVEPFYKLKTLAAGHNQSFMIELNVPVDQEAKNYLGNITIKASDFSQEIPLNLKVRNFTLNTLNSSRTLFLFDQRWTPIWNSNQDYAKQQIAGEVDSAFEHGFNSFEFGLSSIGTITNTDTSIPTKVTGFELSAPVKYALTYASTSSPYASKFTGKNLLELESLSGLILKSNGFDPGTGSLKFSKIRKMLLGPVSGDVAEVAAISELSAIQKTDIQNQLTACLTNLDSQMLALTGKSNSWYFYLADEPGGDKIKVSKWLAETAKASGIENIIVGGNEVNIFEGINNDNSLDAFAVFATRESTETKQYLQGKGVEPWEYQGVYALFDGNEIRNRYFGGFLAYKTGFQNLIGWYYMGKDSANSPKNTVDQMNDFNRTSSYGWNNGRWWNFEYYDNPIYRQSYLNYYGYAIDSVKSDDIRNIDSLQFVGIKQATTDLQYLNTLKSKLGSNDATAAQIGSDFAELIATIPDTNSAVFGFSRFNGKANNIMNKVLLDSYRKQVADWIEQLSS